MAQNIPANRMELFKRKRQLVQAQKGLKMLKDKLEALLAQFMHMANSYLGKKKGLFSELLLAQARYALSASANPELAQIGLSRYGKLTLKKSEFRVVSLLLPKLEIEEYEPDTAIPPQSATTQALLALDSYSKLLPNLVEVAQLQSALRELALEIQTVRRRVNALENVLVPTLQDEVRQVQSKLDEAERASKSRLLRVKDILAKKDERLG